MDAVLVLVMGGFLAGVPPAMITDPLGTRWS
jgi:hypothetical protein